MASRATLTVTAFEVTCPKCGDDVSCGTGSMMWTPADWVPEYHCPMCGVLLSIPHPMPRKARR